MDRNDRLQLYCIIHIMLNSVKFRHILFSFYVYALKKKFFNQKLKNLIDFYESEKVNYLDEMNVSNVESS